MENITIEGFIFNHETRPKGALSSLHYHPSYEMFIITKGSTTLLVDDKLISAHEKEIILLKPNIVHKNIGEKTHDRYSIHFTRQYLTEHFSEDLTNALIETFDNNKLAVKDSVFEEICGILRRMGKNIRYACIHSAEIITLLKDKRNVYIPDTTVQGRTTNNILEYIRKNYASISSLDDIARDVHISKQYLCQVFKKETGITVSDYLNSIRISNACDILLRGRKNITETAILCGYSSTAYFCRVFKNIMKMTPKEYRHSATEI